MPVFTGSFNYPLTQRASDLGFSSDTSLLVSASGSLSIDLHVDAAAGAFHGSIWGDVSGQGALANYNLSAVAAPANRSGYPHTGAASGAIAGQSSGSPDITFGWAIEGPQSGNDFVRFDGNPLANTNFQEAHLQTNGFNKEGTAINGRLSIIDGFAQPLVLSAPNLTSLTGPAVPTLYNLAQMSAYIEGLGPSPVGWKTLTDTTVDSSRGIIFGNDDLSEIVLDIRGTVTSNPRDFVYTFFGADASFRSGNGPPTDEFRSMVTHASGMLGIAAAIAAQHPQAHITLTGHSLGGAIVQLLGKASGYSTVAYDAPGAMGLYNQLQDELSLPRTLGQNNLHPESNVDIRVKGDAISLINQGNTLNLLTLDSGLHRHGDNVWQVANNHDIREIIAQLEAPETTVSHSLSETDAGVIAFAHQVAPTFLTTVHSPLKSLKTLISPVLGGDLWVDPGAGTQFVFEATPNSPLVTAVTFIDDPAGATFKVWFRSGDIWSAPVSVAPGIGAVFSTGTRAFKFEAHSAAGDILTLPDGFLFHVDFASTGQLTASVRSLNGHGPNAADFNGDHSGDILFTDGHSDYQWQLNNRTLAGQGGVDLFDPAFAVQVTGDFDGDGRADVLFENPATGGVYAWLLNGTAIKAQGAVDVGDKSFHILGTADLDGNGTSDVLWRNDSGFLYLWQMNGRTNTPAPVGPLDPSWHVVGAGDFDGDGNADLLLRNTSSTSDNGAFYIWEMNGSAIKAQGGVERPSLEWQTLGTGDFNGDGRADFAVRNIGNGSDRGAVWVYLMDGTHITAQGAAGIADAAVWHVMGTDDYDGDGKDDILFRNDAGFFYSWNMNGTILGSEGALPWAHPSQHVVMQHFDLA